MQLALPADDQITDTADALSDALRTLEPQAPKPLKAVMLQAATELDALRRAAFDSAIALELAATLRAGYQDSDSRHEEIQRQTRLTLTSVAAKLRAVSG